MLIEDLIEFLCGLARTLLRKSSQRYDLHVFPLAQTSFCKNGTKKAAAFGRPQPDYFFSLLTFAIYRSIMIFLV
ncbi:MAG: hypothetical protein J7M27_00965 [Candidatus Latescibacteria bacterium]|nr:hypothetical protein [Candidatus Latescibacterota bacterium]